ncbi:hypothetical protein [Sphingopyxis sp. PET50]|uniref:hypothetical protein n=1 Tax=Sphingopyxis sp. PET50 TaxID=2976533 RepID=UPI0021B04599|nr:hypothetical protein [Sphingopyxis sp. PET50]
MSVSLALMLMAAPDLGAAAPAFMAYDSVCAKADTVETIGARAVAEGWSDFEPERTSPMGYVVGVTRAIAGRSGDRVFRRDGDNLFIWVRETIPAPVGQFVECKIFDFSVAALPSEEAMARLDRAAARSEAQPRRRPAAHLVVRRRQDDERLDPDTALLYGERMPETAPRRRTQHFEALTTGRRPQMWKEAPSVRGAIGSRRKEWT